jgi:hypothetical protein
MKLIEFFSNVIVIMYLGFKIILKFNFLWNVLLKTQ